MSDENGVYIVSGCRTAIGSLGGAFKNTPAHILGSLCIKEALQRACIKPEDVSEVIMGQVLTGGQGPNTARLASLKAGIPDSVPAYTINMLCGSGLKSVYLGFQSIKCGESKIVVAGGQENMSMSPHTHCLRTSVKCGHSHFLDSILTDALIDPNLHMHMGDTAEHLAQKYKVSRLRQDEFAYNSQKKAAEAKLSCFFFDETIPVPTRDGKNTDIVYGDEYPRDDTTKEGLAKLKPVFKGSIERSVTPGNSSGVNDGAAAVVICSGKELKNIVGPKDCFAKIVGFGQTALEPEEMGLGPIQAIRNLLMKIEWSIHEVDLFEINEAFAVQSVLVAEELKIPEEKLNICGGAIALGHPLGASGTRILVTLMYNLRRLDKKRGIAALCVGGGMGIAIAVERC